MSSGLISAGELMRLLNLGFVSHVHPANQGMYCTFVVSLFPMTSSANHCYYIVNQLGQTSHGIPSARTLARVSRFSPTIWTLPTGQFSAL